MKRILVAFLSAYFVLFLISANIFVDTSPDLGPLMSELVIVPDGDYDVAEANAMIERLAKIPLPLLEGLIEKGVNIKLVSGKITDEPEFAKYKGVVPRGWEKTELTWDDVPGVSVDVVIVRIGFSEQNKVHRSFNLEMHETLHAIDRFVLDEVSSSAEFKEVWKKEVAVKYKNDGYVSVYPAEYFAETATLYLFNEETRADLEKNMPLTYQFFDELFSNLEKNGKETGND